MRRRTQCLDRLPAGLGLAAITMIAYGCADGDGPTPPSWEGPLPTAEQVVVQYEADDQLIFLEPLAEGSPTAPLASGLVLEVTVCDMTPGSEECLPVEIAEELDGHYGARWSTDKQAAGHEYSIVVRLNDIRIGELLVTLEQGGGENAGRTFPIKFWVGEGLGGVTAPAVVACLDEDRCHAVVAPSDETTVIVTEDENGNEMAILTLPAGAAPSDLVVTVDCRAGGFAPGDGPLPTALNQWPLFCAVEATLLDGTDFTGVLSSDASMEVCVVDDGISGQAPYHAFDHDDLRLGKSDGPGDLVLLPTAFSTQLLDCSGLTTVALGGPTGRLLDAVGSRFAALAGPFLPQKLHASAAAFSDGGVTGLLRSFSDINPVEVAYVGGSITGLGAADLSGVQLTLTGGFLSGPVAVLAGEDGSFAFEEGLLAGDPGSTYTVTLGGPLPTGFSVLDSELDVFVDGSGLFQVTFVGVADAVVACIDDDRCNAGLAPAGQTTEIVTEDENGNVMAKLTLPAGSVPVDLVVTLDCRAGGFTPGEGPLPTALNQWPLFCHVDATEDGADFTGELLADATMEVCVVDDDDQPQYHAFVHDDLRLGKSDGPGDFQILPTAASTSLASCDGLQTTAAQGPGAGLLDAVGSRFAALLSPILPRKLHATVFSDGGVTGLLRSFSDINPVEPAFVSGSVTGSGVGIGGVTLQISGGSLAAPYPAATTDAQGGYSFSEALNAAGNGGTVYTVEVTGGVPTGLNLDPDQDVTVTGSGTVQVDFVAAGVLFDGGTVAGGSGTVFDWAVGATSGTGPAPFRTIGVSGSCLDLQGFASTVGTVGVWPLGSNTNPTVITLTKQFYVPAGTDALQLTGWVDNDARVTLYDAGQAGTDITGTPVDNDGWRSHENCANVNPLIFVAPSGSFTAGAVNTLVIEVRDRGDIGYADFELQVLAPS